MQNQHKKQFDAKSVHQTKDRCSNCGDTLHVGGFQCPAKKYQCKACHKFGHFTSLCFQKKQASSKPRRPKAHQLQVGTVYATESVICGQSEEDSSNKDSFCLQVKIKCKQASLQTIPRPIHLITNLVYRLKLHHTRNLYLRARLDTCTDVNLMPASVYKLVFQDPNMKKLAPSSLEIGTYTSDTLKIVGSCMFYLVYLDTKKLMEVTLYVAVNDGSVLLSCKTTLMLGLIQPKTRLDYLQSRASLITSSADHPKKTKATLHVQMQEVSAQTVIQEVSAQMPKHPNAAPKLITSKDQILHEYPDVFEGIGNFPGPAYHIQINPSITPKQTPCHPIPVHLKEAFKQEIHNMLQTGVLAPVNETIPWINSFVLVESKDKSGNLKLHICLDPNNLNKVITREPYHFRTPEDIAHLLADACIMTVCNCKKGYWHQKLYQA